MLGSQHPKMQHFCEYKGKNYGTLPQAVCFGLHKAFGANCCTESRLQFFDSLVSNTKKRQPEGCLSWCR